MLYKRFSHTSLSEFEHTGWTKIKWIDAQNGWTWVCLSHKNEEINREVSAPQVEHTSRMRNHRNMIGMRFWILVKIGRPQIGVWTMWFGEKSFPGVKWNALIENKYYINRTNVKIKSRNFWKEPRERSTPLPPPHFNGYEQL